MAPERIAGPRTIGALWRDAVATPRKIPAYLVERGGRWEEVSWSEAGGRVDEIANGLLSLGVRKGDAFGLLAATTLEWALFDFALALVGAIGAPVYASSSAGDCAYLLDHSEAIGVLVEDGSQRAKIDEVRTRLPRLEHVLSFADLDDLAERGRDFAARNPSALDEAAGAVGEEDLFTYIFTSGTTGPPKACMIRHRHYYSMVAMIDRLDDLIVSGDLMLLYLPLAHNFGRCMHLAAPYAGYTIAFCPEPSRIAHALAEVRPTVFPSVPRVYEKVHTAVRTRFDEARGARRALIDWALEVGRRAGARRREGRRLPPGLALRHLLADRLVYSKVKRRLGGRLRIALSGGAPLAPEIAEFFHALDILILEGYGLSECTTAATVNRPSRFKLGTVGAPLPGVEVKTAEDGELLIRSKTIFAGYYKDEASTRAVLPDDGWLRTGDIAEIDDDGFVRITDRKKDIIVTAGGKKLAPQNLENELKGSRFISQALVVGDRRPYVVALVTLDEEEIRRAGVGADAHALVQEAVDEVNGGRSRFEQVKRFAILPRDFSIEEGEVTPTLKLKRRVCEEHFAAEIEELYAGLAARGAGR